MDVKERIFKGFTVCHDCMEQMSDHVETSPRLPLFRDISTSMHVEARSVLLFQTKTTLQLARKPNGYKANHNFFPERLNHVKYNIPLF